MEETSALLREAHARLVAPVFAAVSQVAPDLRPAHGNVMEQLDHQDGMRLVDLAAGAGMTPQSIGELVDQLESLGYVERRPDPEDRRAKRVYRTAKSRAASATAADAASRIQAEVSETLGVAGVENLHSVLAQLIRAFELPEPPPGHLA